MAKRTIGSGKRVGALGAVRSVRPPPPPVGAKAPSSTGVKRASLNPGDYKKDAAPITTTPIRPAVRVPNVRLRGAGSNIPKEDRKEIETLQKKLREARARVSQKKKAEELDRFERGLPFAKLYAHAKSTDAMNAGDVIVKTLKKGKYDGMPAYLAVTNTLDRSSRRPRKYECVVASRDPVAQIHRAKRVWVSCTCQRFLYYYEYALTKYGASKIQHSNGEYPIEKNPSLIPSTCKHLLATMHEIVVKGL
jgi:hypothetical protein